MQGEIAHIRYQEEDDRWIWEEQQQRRRRTRTQAKDPQTHRPDFQVVITGTPIALDLAEFCVLRCLAQRPYHAFRAEEIVAEANRSHGANLSVDQLRQTVYDLRSKLGFFRDYVQTVQHIGYRFRP
jgi:DNA-binding response OmpR family regulator